VVINSNTEVWWCALIIFLSFLLNDLISLFTHDDSIKSYLGGAVVKIILVFSLCAIKFDIC